MENFLYYIEKGFDIFISAISKAYDAAAEAFARLMSGGKLDASAFFRSESFYKALKITEASFIALIVLMLIYGIYRLVLPHIFMQRYGLSALPKHYRLKSHLRSDSGTYSIGIPVWRYPNADGSGDKRRKGNRIIWKANRLNIGHFELTLREPIAMVKLVHKLRSEGHTIAPCRQEADRSVMSA